MAVFEIENLSFAYPGESGEALRQISLSVEEGEYLVVCGASGCGKSTLLRHLKPELTPSGTRSGRVLYRGGPLGNLEPRLAAAEIGFVQQDPENQTVTDKVWHELAFGLESLGLPTQVIRLRVAEMAAFFGMEDWYERDVSGLSGGQLQMLALASVLAMEPRVLILDEPTAQLDPIAAADFLHTVERVNRELAVTVILSEHRLEEVFPAADRVAVMEKGEILCCEPPAAAAARFAGEFGSTAHPVFAGFPSAARIFAGLGGGKLGGEEAPLTVREGARWLREQYGTDVRSPRKSAAEPRPAPVKPAFALREVWFRYDRELPDVLRGAALSGAAGEITCLLGGNGAGKSTALGVLAGLHRPVRGRAELLGKSVASHARGELYQGVVGLLPQNPRLLFVGATLGEDLEALADSAGARERLGVLAEEFGLTAFWGRHPYDLSGGELQKAALAKVLLRSPRVLLLDEPTKGLDAYYKISLAALLRRLADGGTAVLLATHDVEFAAACADCCLLLFNGAVVSADAPGPFFAGNSFYTTAANRIARRLFPDAITCEDVIARCLSPQNPRAGRG